MLFGSNNNQIKIEVIETTKIKIKMRNYWYYYTCSKVIWKRNREYYYNGFNQTIYQFSQNKSVKSYSYYVKTGFKFFLKRRINDNQNNCSDVALCCYCIQKAL